VDPVTNQAFVVDPTAGKIAIVNLAPTSATTLKPVEITELQVPTVSGTLIGGISGASDAARNADFNRQPSPV